MAKRIFYGDVPKKIKSATRWYMKKYNVSLGDAFQWACRTFAPKGTELYDAWYYDDFRKFIPSASEEKYLDFEKYPLKYKII